MTLLCGGAVAALLLAQGALAGVTSGYNRGAISRPLEISLEHRDDASQVFVSPAADGGLTVGWVTTEADSPRAPSVRWRCSGAPECGDWQENVADTTSYASGTAYHSGSIHHAHVPAPRGSHVSFSVGTESTYEVNVPRDAGDQDAPFSIAVVGDLGQTQNSVSTVQHLLEDAPDLVVVPGDLSYADCDQARWDSWGRLVQPMTSSVPLLTVAGNHEIEGGCGPDFQAYTKRFRMPVAASSPPDAMYYSYEAGGVHFLMLSTYQPISPGSAQLDWLRSDLASVDRQRTPWLVTALHAPLYNSNSHHQSEPEPAAFREHAEPLLVAAGADIVFSGHVHAYERSAPASGGRPDPCGVTHITIGDGGNREGLAMGWAEPQPEWSAFRESSYGHGRLVILNATHATWTWHRNNDGEKVAAEDITIVSDTEGCPNSRQGAAKGQVAAAAGVVAGKEEGAVKKAVLRPLRLVAGAGKALSGGVTGLERVRKAAASQRRQ